MKLLRQVLTLCAFLGAMGGFSSALAAENPKAGGAKEVPKDMVLKGDAKCTTCHDENDAPGVMTIGKTRHGNVADGRTPTCTSCHGRSETHEKEAGQGSKKPPKPDVVFAKKEKGKPGSAAPSEAKVQNEACLACHQGSKRMHWAGSEHESRDVACASCHTTHTGHDPVMSKATQKDICFACHKTERAQSHRISTHPLDAGKMSCSDCHNPHGSTGPKLMVKNSINETCYTCHAEKRGPFLWAHPPVDDNCMNCHTPHGSNNAPLLKVRGPYLCQQCHAVQYHPSTAYSGTGLPNAASPAQQLLLRDCANCHSQVHGSNHPSGGRNTR